MSRQRKELTPCEIEAVRAAEAEWLRWCDVEKMMPPDVGVKGAEARLRKAAKDLQKALEPYWQSPGSSESARLVYAMQSAQLFQNQQSVYHQMLENLVEPLQVIERASESLIKKGQPEAEGAVRWVCIAADAWNRAGLPTPTSKGRFFLALEECQLDRSIPKMTPDRLGHALEQWKKSRQFTEGN